MTGFFDALASLSLRALAFCLRKLPLETAVRLGRFTGEMVFYFSNRRHVAYADLKAALGTRFTERERWKIVRDHYGHLGQTATEVLLFPRIDHEVIKRYMKVDHEERVYQVLEEKRGVIFLAGHFGNWELSQIVTGTFGKPIHVLARSQKHTFLNQLLNELRESRGSVSVSRGMGVRDLMRALRRNEFIGLLGDQDAGKEGGIILPFFGRKTTVPTGAYEIAARTGAAILPAFFVRDKEPRHTLHIGEPIRVGDKELENAVCAYLNILEDFITRFPSQWLWGSKRWKYSWTKRVLILSDGKPGHVKQSEALAAQFANLDTQYGRPGMEYPTQILQVRFRSEVRKKIFPWVAFFFIPWAQGRLRWMKFFFTPETQKAIEEASADFIISAGASLIPLNLCLARDSRAKSMVVMKPSFPFNLFRYDLALVPAHDTGFMPRETFRTLLAPSRMDPAELEEAAQKLRSGLRDPMCVKFAVFLGGPTRRFTMDLADIEKLFSLLQRISKKEGDYLVTTSRRTPDSVCRFLKEKVSRDPSCQMLVIAAEDSRPEVAGGMMALADIVIVTEDSISMISEAVSAGKKVIVLSFGSNGLPAKHRRFQEVLARESAVAVADLDDLEGKIASSQNQPYADTLREENAALRARLQEIL